MKTSKNFILWLLLSVMAAPLLFNACKKEEGKCTEESFSRWQSINSFVRIGDNNATINPDGSIYYNFKFAFLEVCTYNSVSMDAFVNFNNLYDFYETLTPYAEVKMYDVYDREIFNWTLMPEEVAGSFRYQDAKIVMSPKEQENIIWVEIRVVVPPSSFPAEETHNMSGVMLNKVEVTLTHHKPNY